MRLDLSSNIAEVLGFTDRLNRQYPFAVAKALTDTARAVHRLMPAEAERDLDNPTPYTKAGFFFTPARKDTLEAVVGVKDRQAEYLFYQVEGGSRAPKKKALRLPSVVQLNPYGNVPAGLIRQLVARAQAGKRSTRTQARRFGVSQSLDLFYGEPGDGRPAGIYKRVALSATRHQLVPVIVFPKQSAKYEKRFDFHDVARRTALREFGPALERSWKQALATAR